MLYLNNFKTSLIILAIVILIITANFIIPPSIEKFQCEIQGGQWNTMFDKCGFDMQTCKDAGGTPKEIATEECETPICLHPTVFLLGCEFK